MKRVPFYFSIAALLALLFTGCCSVDISSQGERDMMVIKTEGWKLFNCIPIASGDPEYPNQEVPIWFCDSVMLEVNMMMLNNAMKQHGYRQVKNLVSYREDESAIPILFKRCCYYTSAEVTR